MGCLLGMGRGPAAGRLRRGKKGRMAKAKAAGGGQNTAAQVEALVRPVIEGMGLRVWDVRFEKEGPDWFLRVLIDRDTPLDTDTCEAVSRAIDPVIDAADPIPQSYYMEVGSPGLGRRLVRDEHFALLAGQTVAVRLIRPDENGRRELRGILLGKDGPAIRLQKEDGGEESVAFSAASYVKLCDDEGLF